MYDCLHYTRKQIVGFIIFNICVLALIALMGCTKAPQIDNAALNNAKLTARTLNELYIPAHKAYVQYYENADEARQLVLNVKVNPYINRATESLINLTTAIVTWEVINQAPIGLDEMIATTKTDVKSAVNEINFNISEK